MLVITRKSKDSISFPQVGVTVHFIRVQGSAARVGIDAPRDIAIVRGEAEGDDSTAAKLREQWLRLPKKVRHEIRNELHSLGIGLHLLREQLKAGLEVEADETFHTIKETISNIDNNEVLRKDSPEPPRAPDEAVVLVEDNDNEREMLAGFLRIKGHQVVAFSDGGQALEYLNSHDKPAVVLMDMGMPNVDGGTAVRALRSDARHLGMRIFAISGSEPSDNELTIGDDGVNRWFRKPLNPQFLLDAI